MSEAKSGVNLADDLPAFRFAPRGLQRVDGLSAAGA
jgi:hypothetical protein